MRHWATGQSARGVGFGSEMVLPYVSVFRTARLIEYSTQDLKGSKMRNCLIAQVEFSAPMAKCFLHVHCGDQKGKKMISARFDLATFSVLD